MARRRLRPDVAPLGRLPRRQPRQRPKRPRLHPHNTCLLDRPQKTVLRPPLTMFPKPSWFSTHRRPEPLAWKLCELYCRPSLWRLPGIFNQALRG